MLENIERRGDELAQLVPIIRKPDKRCVTENHERSDHDGKQPMTSDAIFYARSCSIHSRLLHEAGAGPRLELDFTECGFILRHVLLQYVQQRFGLLMAQ